MKRTRARLVMQMIAVAAAAGAISIALAASPPSFAGDWEYSVKESTYTGRRAYAAARLTITSLGDGFKFVADTTSSDGATVHSEWGGPMDGSNMPVLGNPNVDSVSMLRPNRTTLERTDRLAGHVIAIMTLSLNDRGQTIVASGRRTLPNGQQDTFTVMWHRVGTRR